MKISVELPRVGRKRGIAAGALSASATALWIGAPAYLPFATVSALHVVEGVTLPAAVAWVTLLLMEQRIVRDLRPADLRTVPEQAEDRTEYIAVVPR